MSPSIPRLIRLGLPMLGWSALLLAQPAHDETPIPVTIRVDAEAPVGPFRPIWRFFGADEPNYATLPHGRKLMGELGAMAPGQVYFRAHNLLTSGDGTPGLKWGSTNAYTEDDEGRPVYDWTILDAIFDTYLERGRGCGRTLGEVKPAFLSKESGWRYSLTSQSAGTGVIDSPRSNN